MAHVGIPMGMANQPAKTGSNGQVEFWRALATAVIVVAIGFAVVAAASLVTSKQAGVPAGDRAFDQIEAVRGAAAFSAVSPVVIDHRYDSIENLRGNLRLTAPAAGSTDPRYDVQKLSNTRGAAAPVQGASDPRYDVQKLSNTHGAAAPASGTTDPRYENIDNLASNLRPVGPAPSTVDHRYDNIDNLRANLR